MYLYQPLNHVFLFSFFFLVEIEVYSLCVLSACNLVQYNFEGRYDLVRFVKTIQKAGLYANLRIGPYVCAEWNFGYLKFFHRLMFFLAPEVLALWCSMV